MSRRLFTVLPLVAFLAGCVAEEMNDLEQYVAEVKSREPGPIDPLPEIKQIETFVYVPGERRSPFAMGDQAAEEEIVEPSGGIAPDPLRRKEELEQFPLDSLRMVGTLEQEGIMWALVSVQDGTLFRVQTGNYMGQNHGQITRISEAEIELTEIVPDGTGRWKERQASVALSE